MKTTKDSTTSAAEEQLEDELASMTAHINAATAHWLELVGSLARGGAAAGDEFGRWLAFRCGVSTREAREYVRVAEALEELPAIRTAFGRGALTFSKVRALTKVATPASERTLLGLAEALTASQLERALRAFRQLRAEDARDAHELEFVDYHWGEDGSLFIRARLPAEDGTLLVRALDAARERVRERRRAESAEEAGAEESLPFEAPRSLSVEGLVDVARRALASSAEASAADSPRLLIHVDASALVTDGSGRCDLEDGPVVAPETARRLGCDSEIVTSIEHDGLPISVGRKRRTVPPRLRRMLEVRDDHSCRWPGCERRRYLDAHHRRHWAHGGETSLGNLILLCFHHHRLVHEGGYTIEDGPGGALRFRNRHGLLCPSVPRSPPGSAEQVVEDNRRAGLTITQTTNRNGHGDRLDLDYAVAAIASAFG